MGQPRYPFQQNKRPLEEAPDDAKLYGRKSKDWVEVPAGGIPDAPSDSKIYGRKNAAWSEVGGGGAPTAINEQTGTSYALVPGDAAKGVRMTNAAACVLTIPTNASATLPLYTALPIFQGGAGPVSIAGAPGVTIEAASGAATVGLGDFRTIFQRATDVWVIG